MNIPFLESLTGGSSAILGIDIGSSSLKLVELESSSKGLKVVTAHISPVAPGIIKEGKIDDVPGLAEVLRRAVVNSRSKTKTIAFAVPGSAVITRLVDMPADLSEDELEMQLLLEAEQYIPYSLDEVALDFTQMGQSDDGQQAKVLIAASRKETIESLVEVAEIAELKAKIIDVEPFCLERVYPLISEQMEEDSDSLIAVVDVGSTTLRFNVLETGNTVYSREEMFGTSQLTEEVQRRYGLSAEEANIAQSEGGLPADFEEEVFAPFRESLIQQISRSLQFFYSSSSYNHVDSVVLSGGVIADPEIVKLAEEKLELPVLGGNPFTQMEVGDRINKDHLASLAPSMLVATGLALRGLTDARY